MFGSVVLDVAIGMAFVFLLLSLVASTIQEFLATLVDARSANLHRGLTALFSGGTLEGDISFVERIYNHGLVQGLYRDERDYPQIHVVSFWTWFRSRIKGLKSSDSGQMTVLAPGQAAPPSAAAQPIRPTAAATTPTVQPASAPATLLRRSPLQVLMRVAPVAPISGVKDLSVLPSYIPARTFAIALIDLLNKDDLSGAPAAVAVRNFLRDAHRDHPENKAFEALVALSADAGDDLSRFQTSIEHWYNDAMDRVSGWYKKNTQFVLLWIGLILAVALNVNAIQIAQTLWFDRDVRQSMVASASAAAARMQAPAGQPTTGASTTQLQDQFQTQIKAFQTATDNMLPVGWKHRPSFWPFGATWKETVQRPTAQQLAHSASAAAGWLITAFAISLGAAFWFDTLNKFMVVRSTVKPQEKSRTEGSKDAASGSRR